VDLAKRFFVPDLRFEDTRTQHLYRTGDYPTLPLCTNLAVVLLVSSRFWHVPCGVMHRSAFGVPKTETANPGVKTALATTSSGVMVWNPGRGWT